MPFADSKLTLLLKDALGGGARTTVKPPGTTARNHRPEPPPGTTARNHRPAQPHRVTTSRVTAARVTTACVVPPPPA